jgi:hypothetical protein
MTTTTQTQLRRDTATNIAAATPAAGEPGYDTTNKRLVVGDGATTGGIPHVSYADQQLQKFVYPTVGGTGDAITLTNSPAISSYANGLRQVFKAGANNTTTVTVNVDGKGSQSVQKMLNGALANLTAGDLISGGIYELYYDGTQFQVHGLGKTTQSAGGLVYLGTLTASSSSSLDLTSLISSTYDDYLVILDDIRPGTSAVNLEIRTSTNNGTSFDNGASNYQYAYSLLDTSGSAPSITASSGATFIQAAGSIANGAASALSGKINLYSVNGTSNNKRMTFEFTYSQTSTFTYVAGNAQRISTSAINAIRLLMSSGNITSGTAKMYGIAKA